MNIDKKWLGLKDVILVTLLTALCIIVCTIVVLPFSANIKLVLWVVTGLELILCGPVFILMCAKAPRKGAMLLFAFLFAVYYYFTSSMIVISLMLFSIGVIMELLMLKGGYKSSVRITVAYALFGVGVMMAPVMLMITTKASMVEAMLASGLSQDFIDNVLSVYSAGNISIGVVLTIIGAIVGSLLGYNMLKKHFEPAGIIERK